MRNNKMTNSKMGIASFLSSVFLLTAQNGQATTLNEFLNRVDGKNQTVQTQKLNEEAYGLKAQEGYLLTSPVLFASGSYSSDKKESANPAFEGTQRNSSQYQLGLEQQTSLGIGHKLYYGLDNSELIGADPTFFQDPSTWRGSLNYEFSISLWRNQFGRATQDQLQSVVKENNSQELAARFSQKEHKVSAIVTYWKARAAQELYALSKELVVSNQKFLAWTKARAKDRLVEDIDLKQAEAAYVLREYQLQQAESELMESKEAFNEMLQIDVHSDLPPLEALPIVNVVVPTVNPEDREDLLSLKAQLESQNAQFRMAAEETRPQLDLTGALSSNGLDPKNQEAFNKSFRSDHPAYSVGIKLSIPLDRSSVNAVQKSSRIKSASLESEIQRRQYEVKAEFEKILRSLNQAVRAYQSASTLEKIQYSKYKLEESRRRSGRSSTFQLLSFQQEYQESKQALIRAQLTVVELQARLSLFETSKEENL